MRLVLPWADARDLGQMPQLGADDLEVELFTTRLTPILSKIGRTSPCCSLSRPSNRCST